MDLLPLTAVASQAGNFGFFAPNQILIQRNDTRAPGGNYERGQSQFIAKQYACKEHGVEEPVDDREKKMYSNYFDAESFAARRARDTVLRNFENRVLTLLNDYSNTGGGGANALHFFLGVTAAGAYINAASLSTLASAYGGGGTSWKTVASADPVTDVANASKYMYTNSGLMPNTMVVGFQTYWNLRRNASIQAQIKYSGLTDPTLGFLASRQIFAELFGVEKFLVAGAQYATNNQAAAALTFGSMWTEDYAMIARVARSQDFKETCIGRGFHWEADGASMNGTVETYRDEARRSNIVRVRMDTDEVPLLPQAGFLLTGVNS